MPKNRYNGAMRDVLDTLQQSFLVRWILANAVGWSAGLYLGSFSLRLLNGFFGILIGGAIAGGIVGTAQWFVLRDWLDLDDRRWIAYSALAGVLGALPVMILSFALVIGGVGLALLGAIFGAIFGGVQWLVIHERLDGAPFWIGANLAGGALCAVLSLSGFPAALPIFLTAGPYLFGGITGLALRYARHISPEEDEDE